MRIALMFAAVLMASIACAQDDTRVAQLEKELAEARATIAALESQRDILSQQLTRALAEVASLKGASGPPAKASGDLPLDPFACPDSMLAETKRRYEREIAILPASTAAEKRRRQEELSRWIKGINREVRSQVRWLVAVEDARPVREGAVRGDYEAMVAVLDPLTREPLGKPFRTRVPNRYATRIVNEKRFTMWEATLVFGADLRHVPTRLEAGVFDTPPFVGPEVEFGMSLSWDGLTGFDPDTSRKEKAAPPEPPGNQPSADPSPPR